MLRKRFLALICIVSLTVSLTACGVAEKTADVASGSNSAPSSISRNTATSSGRNKTASATAEMAENAFCAP